MPPPVALLQPLLPALWLSLITQRVPDPYLDEVFHIPQAHQYCSARFDVWDDKITTPPGLYLFSYLLKPFLGCSVLALRAVSAISLFGIFLVVQRIYAQRSAAGRSAHAALNLSLFPPLFFFSGLYYTDVASTLSVLVFYLYFLQVKNSRMTIWGYTTLVLLGTMSVMFRQTNIFWVAIFPAGLTALRQLDQGHWVVKDSIYRRVEGFGDSMSSVARTAWKMHTIYSPSVRDAWLEDYIKSILTVAIRSVQVLLRPADLARLLRELSPYLTLLGLFISFVLWNGSTVLGDKSNHVATIHLAQLLYLWPTLTFFSWPLLSPYFFALPLALYAKLASISSLQTMLIFARRRLVPRFWILAGFSIAAAAVIRWNAIVHPFLLADNRHYTFYVFRLLMRRNEWTRYAVVPGYVLCAWACVQAFGARQQEQKEELKLIPDGNESSATTAFVLVWFATTAGQLATAPLVEPRYLILPWIFWRLHLPLQQYRAAGDKTLKVDWRLYVETVWFLLINAVTGYIFFNWEFTWPGESGVQRFMW